MRCISQHARSLLQSFSSANLVLNLRYRRLQSPDLLDTMSLSNMYFVVCLWTALFSLHGPDVSSACDKTCADKPIFTPSSLVVKYGDPLSATCTACEHNCTDYYFDLEHSIGERKSNTTAVQWTVTSVTEWDASVTCFRSNASDYQCCTDLPVTVYKSPDNVSISVENHVGPMLEGHQYTLQCAVQNVAPIERLRVAFYKGQTQLAVMQSNRSIDLKKPQSQIFSLNVTTSKVDNGVSYWCQAMLALEMPQPSPLVKSTTMPAQVYYKPQVELLSSGNISISEGDPLQLHCPAKGNPSPSYSWTHPSHGPHFSQSSVFIINSTTTSDGGEYICSASNRMGTVSLRFSVNVQASKMPYIILTVVIVIVLILVILAGTLYSYNKKRTGKYSFLKGLHFHKHPPGLGTEQHA